MKKAIVAGGRSILVITWYLLSDPEVRLHAIGTPWGWPGKRSAKSRRPTRGSAVTCSGAPASSLQFCRPIERLGFGRTGRPELVEFLISN
jgi:hypothetical protein